jgi:glucose/arabinose dehydrogenase
MTSLYFRLSLIHFFGLYLLAGSTLPLRAQNGDRDGHVMSPPPAHWVIPPAPVIPADQARATFAIESGFELELVASDPMVQDPVALAFDGNGRIWVAEMKGYMPDIDAKLEASTYGRISILEDTDHDGVADKHTIFLEDYLLPRSLALINGDKGLLFADNEQLYEAEILIGTDGTIKAGAVTVVDDSYAAGGNPEHKPNGLLQALDNWIYSAKCDTRYRKVNGAWIKEKTEERGQWGIAQDNYGRLLTNTNSNLISVEEIAPGLKLRNPEYQFRTKTDRTMADQSLWPSRITPGVNRGYLPGTLSEEGRLLKPTAASGFAIYRGDQFPSEYADQIFITEPAGNLVKRAVVTTKTDGFREIKSGTRGSEFLTSTDERARLVNAYNAPDGTLYFVDLYRGIIQHQVYMTSYLRAQVEERGLDKHIALGRIWRVRHTKGQTIADTPRLSDASSEELVAALSRPSGWWRDTAQRLLVERGDQTAVPNLQKAVAESPSIHGRIHALWTLEGLGAFTPEVLQTALGDPSPHVVAQAVRCAETMANTEQKDAALTLLSTRAQKPDASCSEPGTFWQTSHPLVGNSPGRCREGSHHRRSSRQRPPQSRAGTTGPAPAQSQIAPRSHRNHRSPQGPDCDRQPAA